MDKDVYREEERYNIYHNCMLYVGVSVVAVTLYSCVCRIHNTSFSSLFNGAFYINLYSIFFRSFLIRNDNFLDNLHRKLFIWLW